MTQRLEFSGMNFKAVIIKILQQVITNSLRTNEKDSKFQQRIKIKKQLQILELKKYNIIEIKN